jgi:hypothetical protein
LGGGLGATPLYAIWNVSTCFLSKDFYKLNEKKNFMTFSFTFGIEL